MFESAGIDDGGGGVEVAAEDGPGDDGGRTLVSMAAVAAGARRGRGRGFGRDDIAVTTKRRIVGTFLLRGVLSHHVLSASVARAIEHIESDDDDNLGRRTCTSGEQLGHSNSNCSVICIVLPLFLSSGLPSIWLPHNL